MPKQKILVIDDDPEMRLALQIRLKANNYEVHAAVDGVSAIAETRRVLPDLILLDLGLPAGDGYTVLERLKANSVFASIPILVVSGRDRVVNRARAEEAGAHCFLQKPVKHGELLQRIAQALAAPVSVEPRVSDPIVYDIGQGRATPVLF